jgi:hypothetical protein
VRELQREAFEIINSEYTNLVKYCRGALFKGSASINNTTPEDVAHDAIETVMMYLRENLEALESIDGDLRWYIVGSLKRCCKQEFYALISRNYSKKYAQTIDTLSNQFMSNSSSGLRGVEGVDRRDILDNMDPHMVCVLRQLEDGVKVREIATRLRFCLDSEVMKSADYKRFSRVRSNILREYLKTLELDLRGEDV